MDTNLGKEDSHFNIELILNNEQPGFNERRDALTSLTLDEIFIMEPRLKEIENEILSVDGSIKNFCANREWHSRPDEPTGFKKRMSRLVGWMAENPLLGSTQYTSTYTGYCLNVNQMKTMKHGMGRPRSADNAPLSGSHHDN